MGSPISALFLVEFDQRVGYTIVWSRAADNIDLDGVEYQCLPSGLHSVRHDTVYFVHGSHAGVSAFVQADADASQRNARFVAVGALIPLIYGRLGRSWLHGPSLMQLGSQMVETAQKMDILEEYWMKHRQDDTQDVKLQRKSFDTPSSRNKRTVSDAATSLMSEHALTSDHPALSLISDILDLFGPLIYPLHRATLLRKRILLLGQAPVKPTCNLVYNLSIISSLPDTLDNSLATAKPVSSHILPLFNVGIFDIQQLSERTDKGWIACTTEDILAEKTQLYDLLVRLPTKGALKSGKCRRWPVIKTADATLVRATQRDWRRYQSLCDDLAQLTTDCNIGENGEEQPLLKSSNNFQPSTDGLSDVIEPATWRAMMYEGFIWWASAGEEYAWVEEEVLGDHRLLDDIPDLYQAGNHGSRNGNLKASGDTAMAQIMEKQKTATMLTIYFHRITNQLLRTMADVAEYARSDLDARSSERIVNVSAADMRAMSLDVWNTQDRDFVRAAMALYFDCQAQNVRDCFCGL